MKHPNPDHPITLEPHPGRVTIRLGETLIADSVNSLMMRESTYPPVFYVPRADVRMDRLTASASETYCPYKGNASYYSVLDDDVAWSYENPYEAVVAIGDYLAFYTDKVTFTEA